jgi:hypothetical protein
MVFEMLYRQAVWGLTTGNLVCLFFVFIAGSMVQVKSVNLRTQRVGGLYVEPGHTQLKHTLTVPISSLT